MSETLQASHDALAHQLTWLLGQLIYGSHAPTRMQLLMALGTLRESLPHITPPEPPQVAPNVAYLDDLTARVMAGVKDAPSHGIPRLRVPRNVKQP